VLRRLSRLKSHARRPTTANAKKPPMTPPTMIPELLEDPPDVAAAATDVVGVWLGVDGGAAGAGEGIGAPGVAVGGPVA
jgi:hypothetical protein